MATYYINADTGDDTTGDGSSGSPWETLAKAYSESAVDDTIIFQNSTASYDFLDATMTSRTLEGESVDGVVLDGGGSSLDPVWSIQDMTINNISFTNIYSNNAILSRIFYISGNASKPTSFTGCKFYSIYVFGNTSLSGVLIELVGDDTTYTFTSCLFYDLNEKVGSSTSVLIRAYAADNITVNFYNCTFIFSSELDIFFYNVGNSDGPLNMTNCILYNSSGIPVDFFQGDNGFTFNTTYTCAYLMTDFRTVSGTGNITSDPLFVDESHDNYNLRPTSPCIGTGVLL